MDVATIHAHISTTAFAICAFRCTGKERDQESGLDYFGARFYGSALGRFTSPDEFKSGIVDPFTGQDIETNTALPYADITDPQTLNKYAYVRNNPLRYTDPNGHCIDDLCIGEGALVYAGYTALAGATAAYLASPGGQQALHATGQLIQEGINGIHNLITQASSTGGKEPPQLKAGKEAHQNEEVRPGEKAEVPTPSGQGRMDRYDAEKGHICEIKPDNPRGVQAGERQLDRYKDEMEGATGKTHTTELTKYPPPKPPKLPDQP